MDQWSFSSDLWDEQVINTRGVYRLVQLLTGFGRGSGGYCREIGVGQEEGKQHITLASRASGGLSSSGQSSWGGIPSVSLSLNDLHFLVPFIFPLPDS